MTNEDHNQNEPVIRDKRRIDPETGEVRQPHEIDDEVSAPAQAGEETSSGPADLADETDAFTDKLFDEGFEGPDIETSFSDEELNVLSGQTDPHEAADLLNDLQRITAEYANYRKRTEANRDAERERATGETAKTLLPILDDLDRAEKHGDLHEGGSFAAIAGKLRNSIEKLGLKPFNPTGEAFDPTVHEAIFQQPSSDVDTPTVAEVIETGYYLGSTLLRAAKVVVAVPHG